MDRRWRSAWLAIVLSIPAMLAHAATVSVNDANTKWFRITVAGAPTAPIPRVLAITLPRDARVEVYRRRDRQATPLERAATLPAFRDTHEDLWLLPSSTEASQTVYARVTVRGSDRTPPRFVTTTLSEALARGERHERMVALAVGALLALALAALSIWFVLEDLLYLLYAALIFMQALYVLFLSGQGFHWPFLGWTEVLGPFAWNVPVALSGAFGCLFAREIADLRHFSPRIYAVFGALAWTYLMIAFANAADLVGLGAWVHAIGNLLFLGTALFTVVVAYLAWRAGNRAAGWFLLAWGLLEGVTMTAAIRFLVTESVEGNAGLYYAALPLAMVAAAVLIALGVADRIRQQRLRLTEAERKAQIDPLTGVLNRRSLIERLEFHSGRAKNRNLPLSLLFIDLDHFKEINDTHGHAAGDACLRAVVGPIQTELRHTDVIGRYGGEEFVVILSAADEAAATAIAERIRERVARLAVEGYGPTIGLTCSIGVASSEALGLWGETLLSRADAAVYDAKRSGRNRVRNAAAAGLAIA